MEFAVPELLPCLDWDAFTAAWEVPHEKSHDLLADAQALLARGGYADGDGVIFFGR